MKKIERIIKLIRDSFSSASEVYTNGSCIKFCMILLEIFPEGRILYDMDHAIFMFEGKYYDINGETARNKNHNPIEELGLNMMYEVMNLKHD